MIFVKTVLFLLVFGLSSAVRGLVQEGNKLFGNGKYEPALEKYKNAQVNDPNSAIVRFNLADALAKLGKTEEALKEFSAVASVSDSVLASMAAYNTANLLVEAGDLQTAVETYLNALKLNPDDYDAKHNLELLLRQMSSEKQNQQQKSQGDEKKEKKEEQEKQESQGKEKGEEQQDQQNKERKEMSQEDASRILDAVRSEEEKVQYEVKRLRALSGVQVDKDW